MKSEWMAEGLILAALVFALTVCIERLLIPRLRARAAQPILEIGPAWHLSKKGTPTLGGVGFIAAVLIVFFSWLLFSRRAVENVAWGKIAFLLLFSLLCGTIGLLDDLKKLTRRQNMGLSAWQKYLLLLALCVLFLYLSDLFFGLSTTLFIPFFDVKWEMGWLYYPFAAVYLTGVINALNLTDGMDGLLSTLVAVFCGLLVLLGLSIGESTAFFCGALLLGAVLGFLCFNAHPAKIFMGDTGSLFLGGMVGGYGILSGAPLLVLLAGGVFVIEAVSVILQVAWFKLSGGKRLLRMAPLHHHFEKGGWSEMRVVALFAFWGVLFAVLSFFEWVR